MGCKVHFVNTCQIHVRCEGIALLNDDEEIVLNAKMDRATQCGLKKHLRKSTWNL